MIFRRKIFRFLKMLKTDLSRAYLSVGFLLSTLSSMAVLLYGYYGMYSPINFAETHPVACFINSFVWGNIIYLLFLPPPLAYSASFSEDWQNGFFRPLIMRSSPIEYAFSKCVATSLAGGSSVALGAAIFIAFLLIRGAGGDMNYREDLINASAFHDLLAAGKPLLFFLCYLYIIFLQAMFWAVLGLLASAYFPSKYVAYATPFVLGYLFHQIATSDLGVPMWLNPVPMSTGRIFNVSAWTVLLWETTFFLLLTGICSVLFVRTLKRRIANA